MNFTKEELQKILDDHAAWLEDNSKGKRANLSRLDLRGVNLSCADLSNADLRGTDLRGADLRGANLSNADLRYADLSRADLVGANLSRADLSGADLHNTNLLCADMTGVNLSGSNLWNANLNNAELVDVEVNEFTVGLTSLCPMQGSFIAYKKVEDKIVVLEIPEDARRNSGTTNLCRCDKAKILRIENLDGTPSEIKTVRDKSTAYVVGETTEVENFETDRFNTSGAGIKFFISRKMAVYCKQL
ncbi:MAG: pentapeptide repeat-containing protein [Selenomonadaceae bacterium]|nr:pentapeptide repeat-containing protein [Selenomonadaceae bacterium]